MRMYVNSQTEVQTCGVHNTIGADGSMRRLDIPFAIGSRAEPGDRGRVVDLGTVHSGASGECHSERVRVNVTVSRRVQTCQHLIIERKKLHYLHFPHKHVFLGSVVHTDLVDIEQREKFLDFLRSYQILFGHMPVCAGHLILHLIHSSWRGSNTNTTRLVKADCLQREMVRMA